MTDGTEAKSIEEARPDPPAASKPQLVFISHDSRDAKVAEAFSQLLSRVSAGVLKSFRSSDKSGKQGIAYGVEWFPEIMRNLQQATDVVCLLTSGSVNRPWILFEAGVAKGRLDIPILGLALGIPLSAASAGPFAQFQNSADDEESLVKLVRQLVAKIPNAEPIDDVIRPHVEEFKKRVATLLPQAAAEEQVESVEAVRVFRSGEADAKLFEEVKVMFGDLSSRLDRFDRRSMSGDVRPPEPGAIYRITRDCMNAEQGFKMALSILKPSFPWLYDMGIESLASVKRARTHHGAFEVADRFAHDVMRAVDALSFSMDSFSDQDFMRDYATILSESLRRIAAERSADR